MTQQNDTEASKQSKKGFLLDSLKLGSGTAAGQMITILSMPLLSRLFTPEDFGVAMLFLSIVIVASRVSGGRYEVAVMLPAKISDAKLLFILYTVISLLFSIVLGGIFWFFRTPIAGLLNSPKLQIYFFLVGPAVLVFGLVNGLNFWNTRKKKYKRLATGRLANNGGAATFQAASGLAGLTTPGFLIFGFILGKLFELIIIGSHELLTIFQNLPSRALLKIRALAKKYKKFPQFNLWAVLINNLSWHIPSFMLAGFFSTQVVGWYAIGERTIRAPMNFIGYAISQVFFQRGSEAWRNRNLDILFKDTVGMLIRIGSMPTLIILLLGKDIFTLLLGAEWMEAGVYVQFLSVWAFVWFIASPVSPIISITNNQEKGLIFDSVSLALRIISLLIGGYMGNPRIAIILFGITGVLSYGGLLLWIGTFANVKPRETLKLFLHKNLWWLLFAGTLILLLKYFQIKSIITILIAGIVAMLYVTILVRKNKKIYYPQNKAS